MANAIDRDKVCSGVAEWLAGVGGWITGCEEKKAVRMVALRINCKQNYLRVYRVSYTCLMGYQLIAGDDGGVRKRRKRTAWKRSWGGGSRG